MLLQDFLKNSYTAYHTCEHLQTLLLENGFAPLKETGDWAIEEGGKYFVVRGGSAIIAFTVGSLDDFYFKIAAAHNDSPALKLKENPVTVAGGCAKLNVETYGGGIWHSFMDRPLKIAGRVVKRQDEMLTVEVMEAPFLVTIPSLAIHKNRGVNEGKAINAQVDLQPVCTLCGEDFSAESLMEQITGKNVMGYDLFLAPAQEPFAFGAKNEFLAAPRIDNLVGVHAIVQALLTHEDNTGICVAACLDREEVGSSSPQGADGDFLDKVLRRITGALRFDDNEYYKALANSFLLSVDNAHADHPNHPEVSDPTNRTKLGGGVVIKSHAGGAYVTDALSSSVVKTIFEYSNVKYQSYYNRSDDRSGSTLGPAALRHMGMAGADIGIAQLSMHSACECFALADYDELKKGVAKYYSAAMHFYSDGVSLE